MSRSPENARPFKIQLGYEASLATCFFLVGLLLFFKIDAVPGDLGDGRFNMYILEHGYRWLMHWDKSFWSAPFFYPAQNVVAYSDHHLGSFLFFSLFRVLGLNRETVFQLWAVTIFGLNYWITFLVLKKRKLHPAGAVAGAYLFTFGALMAARMMHIQLAPRFMIPIAFGAAARFLETGHAKYLHYLLIACAGQIYLGIYTGYFLISSLLPFCLVLVFVRKQWQGVANFTTRVGSRPAYRRTLEYGASLVGFVLVLLPVAIPYHQTQQEIGRRTWEEVATMLPRWQSYLHAPASFLWGKLLRLGDQLPMAGEHVLFFGLLPYLAILISLFLVLRGKLDRSKTDLVLAMLAVLVGIGLLTLYVSGFSFYRLAWTYLPGAGGVRAVARIGLVLLYPASFVLGTVVSYFVSRISPDRGDSRVGFLGFGVLAQSIGLQVGQNIAAALTGKMTVDQALQACQTEVERAVRQGGYLK
jgi:hypothetical protein